LTDGTGSGAARQLSLLDATPREQAEKEKLGAVMTDLQRKYGMEIIKSGSELSAEKRLGAEGRETDDFTDP
jgi:hypothetical protein